MRLPRSRFQLSLRTLVILVVLTAMGSGTWIWMVRRMSDFRRLALDYRDMAKLDEIQSAFGYRRYAEIAAYRRCSKGSTSTPPPTPGFPSNQTRHRRGFLSDRGISADEVIRIRLTTTSVGHTLVRDPQVILARRVELPFQRTVVEADPAVAERLDRQARGDLAGRAGVGRLPGDHQQRRCDERRHEFLRAAIERVAASPGAAE